ncbi:MAG: hypothetical protein F4X92_05225, partial [Gammaproteobacteria bacterium]|nr:hypothetical protein [Gammaproteobacteria bacterium]
LSTDRTLSIAAGSTASTGTVTVTAMDNDVDAPDRSVTVSAAASGGHGVAAPADVTLTVTDDDVRGITVSPVTLALDEADDPDTPDVNETEKTYTVALDSEPTGTVTVSLESGDTEVVTLSNSSIEFTASDWGEKTVTVTSVADDIDNSGDMRTATIAHTVSAVGTDYEGETASPVDVTVNDDDDASNGITLSVDTSSIAEDADTVTVTVTAAVDGGTAFGQDTTVLVQVGESGDSATEGTDYAEVDDFSILVVAGSLSATGTFMLDPEEDALDEDVERLAITGSAGSVPVTGTGIDITDSSDMPVLSISAPSVTEGDTGSRNLIFRVTLSGASSQTVSVDYADAGTGTAATPADYTAIGPGTLSFPAGDTEKTVTVSVNGDTVDEGNETVVLRLSSPSNSTLAGGGESLDGTGTIIDDDTTAAGAILSVSPSKVMEEDGKTVIKVTARLTGAPRPDDTVLVISVDPGTAQADDFAEVADFTLTIDAGKTSGEAMFDLFPVDDLTEEGEETVIVSGTSTIENFTVTSASVSIHNMDPIPMDLFLTLSPSSVYEHRGAQAIMVTARFDEGTRGEPTDVIISVGNGTAMKSDDFVRVPDFTLTIGTHQQGASRRFMLIPVNDTADEGDETIMVSGTTSVSNLTVHNPIPISLIDDDTTVSLVLSPDAIDEAGSMNRSMVTARLSSLKHSDVTVEVMVPDEAPVTQSGSMLRIPAGQRESTGTVSLTAVDNDISDPDKLVVVSGIASELVSGIASEFGIDDPEDVVLTIRGGSDPIPKAWLGRFGRTVAEQVVEAVLDRREGERVTGFSGALGGAAFDGTGNRESDEWNLDDKSGRYLGNDEYHGNDSDMDNGEELSLRELMMRSDFTWTGVEDSQGRTYSMWGRTAEASFSGTDMSSASGEGVDLDGDVTMGFLGTDVSSRDLLMGMTLSLTEAEGTWTSGTGGRIESSLVALSPYAHKRLDKGRTVWGVLGVGQGDVTVAPESDSVIETDIAWGMIALGMTGKLVEPPAEGGFGLTAKSDVLWSRTSSKAVQGLLETEAEITRFRLGLEGDWTRELSRGGTFTPKWEIGARHDGGDAETGWGIEVGAEVEWRDASREFGLTAGMKGLIHHEDRNFRSRGHNVSLEWDPEPETELGLSFAFRQEYGETGSGGIESIFQAGPPEEDPGSGGGGSRVMEVAYGRRVLEGRYIASSRVGLEFSGSGKDWIFGWSLLPAYREGALDTSLDVTMSMGEGDGADSSPRIGVEFTVRW